MHARVAALSERWARRVGGPLALHIGVNTGPVVAGNLGGEAGAAYAVTGDTVNTASRLLGAAPAGETFVSRATYLMTQHAFTFDALPDLSVKGKAEPLAAYRLRAVRGAPHSARGLEAHGLTSTLVGRDEEIRQLVAAFDRMLGGRAQVVSLVGEAGSGKSRLVRELMARLAERGDFASTTVRRAACSPSDEQAVRRTVVVASSPRAESVARNSRTSRDFPVPASPTRLTTCAWPPRMRWKAATS
jgi:adenylate cyclase